MQHAGKAMAEASEKMGDGTLSNQMLRGLLRVHFFVVVFGHRGSCDALKHYAMRALTYYSVLVEELGALAMQSLCKVITCLHFTHLGYMDFRIVPNSFVGHGTEG